MPDVTRLLEAAQAGDRQAAANLLPLVYDELRKLAAARMSAEAPGHTLDATALVHEAYLRLVLPTDLVRWECRGHFFSAAADAMRRILIESARRKKRLKHGGGRERVALVDVDVIAPVAEQDVLALDAALTQFAVEYPVHAQIVSIRYFAGQSLPEVARLLGISDSTADRYWAFARAWLRAAIADAADLGDFS